MFVRKKRNKSGVNSVQIIDKSSSSYKVIKTMGSSARVSDVERLVEDVKNRIKKHNGLQEIDFTDYRRHTGYFPDGIESLTLQGTELLPGRLFDETGFNQIKDELFR
jgi:hypothetical protein